MKNMKMEMKNIKENQSEMKNILSEMKRILKGINRVDKEEVQTIDIEDGEAKDNQSEQQEKRSQDDNTNLRSLWDTSHCKIICVIGVPEGKQEIEELFEEITMENFPNLLKEIDIQAQKAQRVPKKKNPNRPTPTHIIIKMPTIKYKDGLLKAARQKQLVNYKAASIRLADDCSKESM
uniref:L1 transposable element RRM domain-containing protein n=1 Tax=Rousettus aegyptiacus TaxID=9407 RepID=A0A7J8BFI5_ROUAE|nr:hypothetical protein HJG63_009887 [Rousettus aegyptiacus]